MSVSSSSHNGFTDIRPLRPSGVDHLTTSLEKVHVNGDPFFRPLGELTDREAMLLAQRRAALLYVAGLTPYTSLRDCAAETGVGVSTLHKVAHRISRACGIDFAIATKEARQAWAAAARRRKKPDSTRTTAKSREKTKGSLT